MGHQHRTGDLQTLAYRDAVDHEVRDRDLERPGLPHIVSIVLQGYPNRLSMPRSFVDAAHTITSHVSSSTGNPVRCHRATPMRDQIVSGNERLNQPSSQTLRA